MRRVLLFVVFLVFGAARADALTVRDIIELSKTGLSDEVLLALIEVERSVFPVDTATLKLLKQSGVSDKVIVAMVRSGRTEPPAPPPMPLQEQSAPPLVAEQPAPVVIEHHEVAVPVAVPVYYPVYPFVSVPHQPHHGRPVQPVDVYVPPTAIGLPHPRLGLSSPPPRPTSDPPYWNQQIRRSR